MIKKISNEIAVILIVLLSIILSSVLNFNLYEKFSFYNTNFEQSNLKKIFIEITEIGNSLWIFLTSFFCFFLFFFLEKKNSNNKNFSKLKIASALLFGSTLVAGIITQLLKHIVGRARPNHASEADYLGINFFNFDSAFHSFPSGHTSTIFVVAIVLSFVLPKLKYFFLFFSFIVGLSRVVVGAHYLSDVIGGIAVAFIGVKIVIWIFHKLKKNEFVNKKIKFEPNLFFLSLIIFLIIIIFLTVGASIDIFVGELAYRSNEQFVLQSNNFITILAREIFLPFIVLYLLILPLISLYLPINKIYFNYKFNSKNIFFIWLTLMLNNILIVNFFLKGLWGRVRPNEIYEFGGGEIFSPWYKISSACNSNCSFVSGDASVGFSLICLYFLTGKKIFFWIALFAGSFLGLIRILEGGHFLSDVSIAGFIIFTISYYQFVLYKKKFVNDL